MHFVGPLAHLDSRLAGRRGKYARHWRTVSEKVRYEAVFLEKAFGVADGAVMALDEDAAVGCADNGGSG